MSDARTPNEDAGRAPQDGHAPRYRDLVETSNDLIWSIDTGGRWSYLNAAAVKRIYGAEPAAMLGQPFENVLVPAVRERDLAVLRRVLEGETVHDYQTRHLRVDGETVDLSFNAIPLRDAAGAIEGATGTARDITAQLRATAALYETVERLRLAVDVAELKYWEWETATDRMHHGNGGGASVVSPATTLEAFLRTLHAEDRERFRAAIGAARARGQGFACDYRVVDARGTTRWFAARARPVFDAAGAVQRLIGVSQDITDRKRAEDEARFLAHHDTLTGLPNRRLLDDRMRQAIAVAQRRDTRVAALLIDLDGFKQVNDVLGHGAGDRVLREAAQRLAGSLRKSDTLARQGGDEFVIVIPDLRQENECRVVAEKAIESMRPEFAVDGRQFAIGASIGIALSPADGEDGEALLRNADIAMYRAKRLGRNHYCFYGH